MNAVIMRDQQRPPERDRVFNVPMRIRAAAPEREVVFAATGQPVLRIIDENGRLLTLHSRIDPVAEARRCYGNVRRSDDSITVIIGAGSGYHIDAIIRRRGGTVIVIERDPDVLRHMCAVQPVDVWIRDSSLYMLSGDDHEEILRAVSRIQTRHGLRTLIVVEHGPSLRAAPAFYQPLCRRLRATASVNIVARFRYRKFAAAALRVLVLHSRYYLLPEIMRALARLGHSPRAILLDTGPERTGSQEMIEKILAEIIRLKPDFVLTVNHLGFDRAGILTRFFTDIELPYASWFVDSPLFILEDFQKQRSPFGAFFVWDRDYCTDLAAKGFDHVVYLPLAADTDVFTPGQGRAGGTAAPVAFVGNSGDQTVAECLHGIGDSHAAALVERLAAAFEASPCRTLSDIAVSLTGSERALLQRSRGLFEQAVTWRATQRYRIACVRELSKFSPVVYGDEGWKRYLNGSTVIMPELNYYEDLPRLYPRCTINFNTTSLQMKSGMNQRVFDVPACCAFLLTDYRSQIEDAFEIDREVVCYRDVGEIQGLVSYYLKHEQERRRIAAAAFTRVRRQHTYVHRLDAMVRYMRNEYA